MQTIRFTKHYRVRDAEGREYKPGDEIELNDASAGHFLNRGVAVAVNGSDESPAAADDDGGPSKRKGKGK